VSFLLDTNLVSEWVEPRPDPGVVAWLAEIDEERVFTSVVSFAEIRRGLEKLAPGGGRSTLEHWLTYDLHRRLEGRILRNDLDVAHRWGRVTAERSAAGRPIATMDAFMAATAEVHDLALVTRNAAHFEGLTCRIVNPWT